LLARRRIHIADRGPPPGRVGRHRRRARSGQRPAPRRPGL